MYRRKERDAQRIRAGFLVRAKFFNAVKRNRIKRLMREAFRHTKYLLEENLPEGLSVAIMFSSKTTQLPLYENVREEIELMMKKVTQQKKENKLI